MSKGNEKKNSHGKRRVSMMISKFMKKAAVMACCVALIGGVLTGCGSNNNSKDENNSNTGNSGVTNEPTKAGDNKEEDKKLSGSITLIGSTSMEKLSNAVAEDFMNKNRNVTVTPEFVGSGAGIEAVINGTADIGNSSRNLKDAEKEAGAVENIVAIDGIAVVLDKSNTVTNLTKDQLIGIYTGTIRNWSELGGNDQPIVVIGREAGSGTRGAFEEILKVEDQCVYANELDNTGAVMAKVASTKGAIGYVSLDVVDDSVTVADLEGVAATAENIKAGNYFLSRPFVMATKGEISEQSELIQAFFEYLKSEDGKAIIEAVGLITVD